MEGEQGIDRQTQPDSRHTDRSYPESNPIASYTIVKSLPKAIFNKALNELANQYRDSRLVPGQVSASKSSSNAVKINPIGQPPESEGRKQELDEGHTGEQEVRVTAEEQDKHSGAQWHDNGQNANQSRVEPEVASAPDASRTTLASRDVQNDHSSAGSTYSGYQIPLPTISPPVSSPILAMAGPASFFSSANDYSHPHEITYNLNDPNVHYSASFQSSYPPGSVQAYGPANLVDTHLSPYPTHTSLGHLSALPIQMAMFPIRCDEQPSSDPSLMRLQDMQRHSLDMRSLHDQIYTLREAFLQSRADCARLSDERHQYSIRLTEVEELNKALQGAAFDMEKRMTELADDLKGSKAQRTRLQQELVKKGQQQKNRANDSNNKATEISKLKEEKDDLVQELQSLKSSHAIEVKKLNSDVAAANKEIFALSARVDADMKIADRSMADIDGLVEQVRQLEIKAAFTKIGGDSIDVPARLDGIFGILDELPELILDQISGNAQAAGLDDWKGDLNELPARVVDFYYASKLVKSTTARFLYYAIQNLVMYYIKAEIWDTAFHPVICRRVQFDTGLREEARILDTMYRNLIAVEPYIKACNWRILSSQAMWRTVAKVLGQGNLESALDAMTSAHIDFVIDRLLPNLVTTSPMHPLDYGIFRKKLSEIIKEVLQLKYEVQTRDARYEYSLEVPSLPHDSFKTLTLGTPISCKTPRYIRWETSSDSKATRVSKVQQEAKYHTAGDAGWVAKPKKS